MLPQFKKSLFINYLALLGRHVICCPHDHTWRCIERLNRFDGASGRRCFQFCQAEVENLDSPVDCYKDVLRFEISVDDGLGVSCSQAVGDLASISKDSMLSDCTLPQVIAQFFALEEFRHDVWSAVDYADIVNG